MIAAVAAFVIVAGACVPLSGEGLGTRSAGELGLETSRSDSRYAVDSTEPGSASRADLATGPGAGSGEGTEVATPDTIAPAAHASSTSAPVPAVAPPTTAPTGTYVTPGERLGIAGCPLFPRDNAFHASIARLPVHPESDSMIAAAGGADVPVKAGFTASVWEGSRGGYPVNIADSRTSEIVDVVGGVYARSSDLLGHPVPTAPRFEGWPNMAWDKHLLVVDPATCTSHEMFFVTPPERNPLGFWFADKAVKIDLRSNEFRRHGSVKAAGVSMLAGLVRYDEVASGDIDHVISMSIHNSRQGPAVWPANASDGPNPDQAAPPMGSWFRLRPDTDLSGLGPQARVVAQALKDHGGVVVDTSGQLSLSGEPDLRWDDKDLKTLRTLSLAQFDIIDPTPMVVSEDSLQIR